MVLPIVDWLKKQGVTFVANTKINNLDLHRTKMAKKSVVFITIEMQHG